MGLFSKSINNTGAIWSIVIGLLITIILIISTVIGNTAWQPHFLYTAGIHFAICCMVLAIGSRFGTNKDEAALAQLVWTDNTFKEETLELIDLAWYKNYRYQAIALIVVVIFILLMY